MKIKEVAKLTGITVRTLHYYDEIELLKPSEVTESGYRIYHENDLKRLQQILFFRELEFPLSDIRKIMNDPCYDEKEVLERHRKLLLQKRDRLDGLIELIGRTVKEGESLSFKEFDRSEFEANRRKYAAEVKKRWGHTAAFRESEKKTAGYDNQQWEQLQGEVTGLLCSFGVNRRLAPDSEEAQELVKKWQDTISTSFYHCTDEILAYLGKLYVSDARFTENIDKNGRGTAEFMAKAIAVYCKE